MASKVNRRNFLRHTVTASAGASALGFGYEEKQLARAAESPQPVTTGGAQATGMPTGEIKGLKISRLICGGNLISGFAHSRDLIYVSSLLNHYFTDEKVIETLQIAEENGVNTAILRYDENCRRILNTYWRERGGKIQWIAQVKAGASDPMAEAKAAVDNGASGYFLHGGVGDSLVTAERVDLIGEVLSFGKMVGVPAGVAGHMTEVPMACEKAGLDPDFYMKTFNAKNYWSAGPMPRKDSVWEETPERTRDFMKNVTKPWIAYKVLGAGAIHPQEGFEYAFKHGADFICVGMFDFQVRPDALMAKEILAKDLGRTRPWCA